MGGALWSPGDTSCRPGGGAAWQSWPRGPAIGRGVAPFSRPPLPRAGFSRRPSLGPLIPRPLSRGAGRPGVAVRVSGQWLAGCGAAGSPPRSLYPPSLPREVARSPASCRTVGPARARGLGGGATARVNGGAQRAHHPSDRSVSEREGGGGSGGGPLVPWRRSLTAEGGAAWRSRPQGPAIGWGVAPFPHPPLPRARPSCRP